VGVVALVSGSGTNLQALIDATADPAYGVRILAVGADRDAILGLERAERAGIPTFVCRVTDYADRGAWDAALAAAIGAHDPALVVSAGFMKLLGPEVLGRFTVLNTHPALLPAFPGAHAVRDALAHGVRVTGCTVHVVDDGVDTGPILAQRAVPVLAGDSEGALHERIKTVERELLVDTVGRAAREGITVTDRKASIP
jgi:phosphoribosylglycinamide formyltransferase-1